MMRVSSSRLRGSVRVWGWWGEGCRGEGVVYSMLVAGTTGIATVGTSAKHISTSNPNIRDWTIRMKGQWSILKIGRSLYNIAYFL